MDFLDPKKQRAHMIRLIVGYVLIAIAILIATIILLYQAYGFGLGKDGEIIQNGLVYVSSKPRAADIYLNGTLKKDRTNAKLQLPAGDYALQLKRDGYRDWQRSFKLEGGIIEHFDYPLLFPATITQTKVKDYNAAPGLVTQTPDRRWLMVQQTGSAVNFDAYDLNDPQNLTTDATVVTVPEAAISSPKTGDHTWKLVEWSTDNRHVLLEHAYTGGAEYVMVDREEPASSVNLTKSLQLAAGHVLSLRDKKFDKYYVFDAAGAKLNTASRDDAAQQTPLLTGILAFKSYGADKIVYATADGAPAGKVVTMLKDGDTTYKIREQGAAGPYLMDMARYDGDWIVVVGSASDNKIYVYKNPQLVRKSGSVTTLVPVHILKVNAPNYIAFSSTTQYVIVQNGNSFASYDAETNRGYAYTTASPIDAPATHATWMDASRLTYISGGKVVAFDYDNENSQTLMPATSNYLPFFDRDYDFVYTLTPGTTPGASTLSSASLLTDADR